MSPHPSRRTIAIRQTVAVAVCLFAAACVVAHLVGCGSLFARAGAATSTGAYERDLDECLKDGRRAHSLAVYEACAREMDIKHGVTDAGGDR